MQNPEGLTCVEIYDQFYQIKGGIETDYVKELAAYVDSKMHEIAPRKQDRRFPEGGSFGGIEHCR